MIIGFHCDLIAFVRRCDDVGLDQMAAKAREVAGSYKGNSLAHEKAWTELAEAIEQAAEKTRGKRRSGMMKAVKPT